MRLVVAEMMMALSGPMTLTFQALCDGFPNCDTIFMRKLRLHVKCAEALVLLGSFFCSCSTCCTLRERGERTWKAVRGLALW